MSKDNIFSGDDSPTRFRFDQQVAEVFDDMLNRSVPFYREVIRMSSELLAARARPGDTIYDLGCSTGATVVELARHPNLLDLRFVGIDSSEAMIEKARLKAGMFEGTGNCRFEQGDITAMDISGAGAIILNYTLQFIEPNVRPGFMHRLQKSLRPGGVLILSEKLQSQDSELSTLFGQFYADFKRRLGYSDLEISRKREALENVLIPLSMDENRQLLTEAGFNIVEPFFQWFNFGSFVAIKGE